jgi:hypothetical protein
MRTDENTTIPQMFLPERDAMRRSMLSFDVSHWLQRDRNQACQDWWMFEVYLSQEYGWAFAGEAGEASVVEGLLGGGACLRFESMDFSALQRFVM